MDRRCTNMSNAVSRSILALALLVVLGCDNRTVDYTRGVSAVCWLHGTQMTKTNVSVEYGLIRLNDWGKARQAASSNSFPNAAACVLGGCIAETPTQAVVYVCSQCELAQRKWESRHPWPYETNAVKH
jgi:hypothetical protein